MATTYGRLDRFGDNTQANVYITAIPKTLADGKQNGACARFLNQSNCLQSAKAWYEFLKDKITDNPLLSIAEVYQIYQEFMILTKTEKLLDKIY